MLRRGGLLGRLADACKQDARSQAELGSSEGMRLPLSERQRLHHALGAARLLRHILALPPRVDHAALAACMVIPQSTSAI